MDLFELTSICLIAKVSKVKMKIICELWLLRSNLSGMRTSILSGWLLDFKDDLRLSHTKVR